jgi:HK97 family phage prohead protease
MKLQRLESLFEIKAASETGEIEGYGNVYGVEDLGGDVVEHGAFADSLARRKAENRTFPMLWQHDAGDPVGVWTDYSEDGTGLRLKGRLLTSTTRGRDAYAFVREKAVEGLSVGFMIPKGGAEWDDGARVRRIRKADLWEVSLATFPMNPAAGVTAVKIAAEAAEMTERDIERALRDAGLSARDAKAAVSRCMDLGAQREAAQIRSAVGAEMAAKHLLNILKK